MLEIRGNIHARLFGSTPALYPIPSVAAVATVGFSNMCCNLPIETAG